MLKKTKAKLQAAEKTKAFRAQLDAQASPNFCISQISSLCMVQALKATRHAQ